MTEPTSRLQVYIDEREGAIYRLLDNGMAEEMDEGDIVDAFRSAHDRIHALEAENAALLEDKTRLDWLQEQSRVHIGKLYFDKSDVRQAIDATRKRS